MEITFKRQSVLAGKRLTIVNVGAIGNDTVAYMKHLITEVDALNAAILEDARQTKVDECVIKYEETNSDYITAEKALNCAGIESPTEDQKEEYEKLLDDLIKATPASEYTDDPESAIKSKSKANIAKFIANKKGSGSKIEPPHTDAKFRQEFSYWYQDWGNFQNENNVDLPLFRPSKSELDTWYNQMSAWYDKAIKLGIKINRPKPPPPKDEPNIVPTWVWIAGIGIVLVVVASPLITSFVTAKALAR
jgi:hypothetical protein